MKQRILGVCAIVLAAFAAFAFTAPAESNAKRVDFQFQLTPGADPFVSTNYTASNLTPAQIAAQCPLTSKVCVIIVPDSDVLPSGKPNVANDPLVSNELADDIAAALATAGEPLTVRGRTIHERN